MKGCVYEVITPSIDKVAKKMECNLNNFYCVSPICSLARAPLLTGKIPSLHGAHDWITEADASYCDVEFLKDQIGYTDILKANGYICGLSGKWRLKDSLTPQKSFDHWYAHMKGGGPHYAPMALFEMELNLWARTW